MYIAVNIKSKEILLMKLSDEHVHDNNALHELVDDIIKSNNIQQYVNYLLMDTPVMTTIFLDI
jgi:hypothetical protein